MLTRVRISNFRSLGPDTRVSLEPMTVLVGQNGSGKSNFVDALRFVADAMTIGLEGAVSRRHGISAVRRWSSGHPVNLAIGLSVKTDTFQGRYDFELTSDSVHEHRVKSEQAEIHSLVQGGPAVAAYAREDGVWISGPPELRPSLAPTALALPLLSGDERFRPLAEELRRVAVYTIFPDILRELRKYEPVRPMELHGGNWVSILKDQDEATWKPELVGALRRLTGEIDDIEIRQAGGLLFARFRHGTSGRSQRSRWFDASQESDGTLRVAGILTALLQQPRLSLVGIEEPELTVHPGAVGLVHDFLRQAARDCQVLVTTHSPELLDLLEPEMVRVVERTDGVSHIAPMDTEQADSVRQRLLTLGDVQRYEGIRRGQLPLFDSPVA